MSGFEEPNANEGTASKGHVSKIMTQLYKIYKENKLILLSLIIFIITLTIMIAAHRTKNVNIYWSKQNSSNKKCSPETSSEEEQKVSISPKKKKNDMYIMVGVILMVTFFIFLIAYFNYASS